MSCEKSSNNKFFNSAARMADGRIFTDYRPNHEINRHIINNNKIENVHNFRMFLSRNADEIMKRNKEYIFLKSGVFDCKKPFKTGTMLQEKTRVVCDPHNCKRVVVNENGHGEGREYVTNPPNSILDPLEEPEVKLNNVCATSGQSMNYYPIDRTIYDSRLRGAIPGGGELLSGGDPNVLN